MSERNRDSRVVRPGRRRHEGSGDDSPSPKPSTEFAWRIHDGVGDWTARVDAKASIALAIEAAVAGLVTLIATGDGELADASGLTAWCLGVGVVLLSASVVLSVLVVFPQLRGRATRHEFSNDVVYFGHLRLWNPDRLAARLAEDSGELPGLSRQLVRMSKIAWRKHVWLQWSLALFVAGVLAVGCAFVSDRAASSPIHGEPTPSSPASAA